MERGTKNTRPKANLTQDRSTNFITQTYLQKGSTCSQKFHDTSISSSSKCISIYRRTNQRFRQGTIIVRSLFCGDLLVLSPIRCCLVDNHRLQLEVYPSDSKDLCVATYYYKTSVESIASNLRNVLSGGIMGNVRVALCFCLITLKTSPVQTLWYEPVGWTLFNVNGFAGRLVSTEKQRATWKCS